MTEQVMTLNALSPITYDFNRDLDEAFGLPNQFDLTESSTSASTVASFGIVFLSNEGIISRAATLSVEESQEYKVIKQKYLSTITKLEDSEED